MSINSTHVPPGEKPYQCPECEMSFYVHHHMKTHLAQHAGRLQHSCPHCSKAFTHKHNLAAHVRKHHSNSASENSMAQSSPSGKCTLCSCFLVQMVVKVRKIIFTEKKYCFSMMGKSFTLVCLYVLLYGRQAATQFVQVKMLFNKVRMICSYHQGYLSW